MPYLIDLSSFGRLSLHLTMISCCGGSLDGIALLFFNSAVDKGRHLFRVIKSNTFLKPDHMSHDISMVHPDASHNLMLTFWRKKYGECDKEKNILDKKKSQDNK